jgi:ATP adenylyltransferase
VLDPLQLPAAIDRVTAAALACGALEPIATDPPTIRDRGVDFRVRILRRQLVRKQRARQQRGADFNPFLPYDPDLFVGDISPSHVCLLNKFNVLERHLLIVTREFEDQAEPLTDADFQAMVRCLSGVDGLAFYNGGVTAGASQPHKHLQLVAALAAPPLRVPMEALIAPRLRANHEASTLGKLGFTHRLAALTFDPRSPEVAAETIAAHYSSMLAELGCGQPPTPYNLLVTRDWMLMVSRSREHFGATSINALGFAGSLFVRDQGELAAIRERRPLDVLTAVAWPRH